MASSSSSSEMASVTGGTLDALARVLPLLVEVRATDGTARADPDALAIDVLLARVDRTTDELRALFAGGGLDGGSSTLR